MHQPNHPQHNLLKVISPKSLATLPSFFHPNHGLAKSLFNFAITFALCSTNQAARFSFGNLNTVSSNSFHNSRRRFVNRLPKLAPYGENTTGFLHIRPFPLTIRYAGRLHDQILDTRTGVRSFGDHDATGKQESIKRHRLSLVLVHTPFTRQIRPHIFLACLLPQRELEAELTWVDVKRVEVIQTPAGIRDRISSTFSRRAAAL
jgi:hypothetical protein